MDRFDLEQKIMQCWNVTEDIQVVLDTLDNRKMTDDELANALIGVKTMYDLKFEQLFDMFSDLVHQGIIK